MCYTSKFGKFEGKNQNKPPYWKNKKKYISDKYLYILYFYNFEKPLIYTFSNSKVVSFESKT
jgi:hypothetical protein